MLRVCRSSENASSCPLGDTDKGTAFRLISPVGQFPHRATSVRGLRVEPIPLPLENDSLSVGGPDGIDIGRCFKRQTREGIAGNIVNPDLAFPFLDPRGNALPVWGNPREGIIVRRRGNRLFLSISIYPSQGLRKRSSSAPIGEHAIVGSRKNRGGAERVIHNIVRDRNGFA